MPHCRKEREFGPTESEAHPRDAPCGDLRTTLTAACRLLRHCAAARRWEGVRCPSTWINKARSIWAHDGLPLLHARQGAPTPAPADAPPA